MLQHHTRYMAGFEQAKLLEIDGAHVYETPAGRQEPNLSLIHISEPTRPY